MTTIKDYLRDLANDVLNMKEGDTRLGDLAHNKGCVCKDCIEELITKYAELLKERIVG